LLRLAEHVDQYQDVGMALERLTLWIGSGEGRETLLGFFTPQALYLLEDGFDLTVFGFDTE